MYNRLNSTGSFTRSLLLQENLRLEFRPELAGDGHYDFGDHRSDQVASRSHEGRAAVRHQLYKSLRSTLAVQGATLDSHGGGTKLGTDRLGVAVEENYTRRLPARSQLTVGANWRGDLQRRQTAGQLLNVANEAITLSDRTPSFLSQTGVIAVGRVTNALGVAYVETLDYVWVAHAPLLEIRRVPGGNIPNGGVVLVNYTAAAPPSDQYSTVMQFYQVRFDLFNGLLGLYARLNQVDNQGSKSVVLRDLSDRVAGAELSWRWLGLGAERDRQDSNLSPFHSSRVYQSLAFDLGPGSTLAFDCEQSRTTYVDTGRTRASRSFIGRYRQQLGAFLACHLEGGLRRERGVGFDQDRVAVRVALNYAYGKLRIDLSYDFEDEDLLGELHRRQHVLLRAKRTF